MGRIVVCSTLEKVFKSDPQNTCVSVLRVVADLLEPGTIQLFTPPESYSRT